MNYYKIVILDKDNIGHTRYFRTKLRINELYPYLYENGINHYSLEYDSNPGWELDDLLPELQKLSNYSNKKESNMLTEFTKFRESIEKQMFEFEEKLKNDIDFRDKSIVFEIGDFFFWGHKYGHSQLFQIVKSKNGMGWQLFNHKENQIYSHSYDNSIVTSLKGLSMIFKWKEDYIQPISKTEAYQYLLNQSLSKEN